MPDTVVVGDLVLSGEVRSVPNIEKRVKEAEKLGFKRMVIPSSKVTSNKIELLKVRSLRDEIKLLF